MNMQQPVAPTYPYEQQQPFPQYYSQQPQPQFVAPQTQIIASPQSSYLSPTVDALFFNSSYMLIRQRKEPLNFIGIDQANSVLFQMNFSLFIVTIYSN